MNAKRISRLTLSILLTIAPTPFTFCSPDQASSQQNQQASTSQQNTSVAFGSVIDFSELINKQGSETAALDHLLAQDMVILKFYATWCPPCRQLSPCFVSIARQHARVLCVEVNIETYPNISDTFHVRSVPTLIFLRNGVKIGFRSGFRNQKVLEDDVNSFFSPSVRR